MTVELDVRHPFVLGRQEGEVVTDRERRSLVIKAAHELVTLTRARYAAGERGTEPHVHHRHDDAFYVISGALDFRVGPELEPLRVEAGGFVLVPQGVVHAFDNEGPDEVTYLNVHAPDGGFAEYLRGRANCFDSEDSGPGQGLPADEVVARAAGLGDLISLGPSSALFKAEVGDGGGHFSLTETTVGPGFPGPLPHRHERLVDSFYVLEGTLRMRLGDDTLDVPEGSYAFVPPGTVHTFSNPGDAPVRILNLMAPGGFEQYLKQAAAATPAGAPPDPRVMAEIASRYDFVAA